MADPIGSVDFSSTVAKLENISEDMVKAIAGALYVGGKKIEESAKLAIQQGKKTGRIYKRGNVTHQASAAGEAPASDLGKLASSLAVSQSGDGLIVQVKSGGTVADYAVHLEYGTENIAPRPFMKPALNDSRAFIEKRMEKAIKSTVSKHAK